MKLRTIFLLSVSLLICSPAHLLPRAHAAVSPADLEALKQLFRPKPCFAKTPPPRLRSRGICSRSRGGRGIGCMPNCPCVTSSSLGLESIINIETNLQ